MYKIEMVDVDKYDFFCYYYDENTHTNVEAWRITNISAQQLEHIMQGRRNQDLDAEFTFAILRTNNGPVLFSSTGDLLTISSKKEIPIKEIKTIFSGEKKRRNI